MRAATSLAADGPEAPRPAAPTPLGTARRAKALIVQGKAQLSLGNRAEALVFFQRARALIPSNERLQKKIEKIRGSLRQQPPRSTTEPARGLRARRHR